MSQRIRIVLMLRDDFASESSAVGGGVVMEGDEETLVSHHTSRLVDKFGKIGTETGDVGVNSRVRCEDAARRQCKRGAT